MTTTPSHCYRVCIWDTFAHRHLFDGMPDVRLDIIASPSTQREGEHIIFGTNIKVFLDGAPYPTKLIDTLVARGCRVEKTLRTLPTAQRCQACKKRCGCVKLVERDITPDDRIILAFDNLQSYLNLHFARAPLNVEQMTAAFDKTFGVNVRQDSSQSELFLFKYQGLLSKWHFRVTHECRGAILQAKHHDDGHITWHYCSRPWDKFFNLNQSQCRLAPVHLQADHLYLHEKVDGTAIQLWYNPTKAAWHASTLGSIPTGEVRGYQTKDFTYASMFWEQLRQCLQLNTIDATKASIAQHLVKGYTYLFEVATPYNQVVTSYPTPRLVLLGIRDCATGRYVAKPDALPFPTPYRLHVKDILPNKAHRHTQGFYLWLESWLAKQDKAKVGTNPEGVVLLHGEAHAPLAKIKSERYLQLHGAATNGSVQSKARAIATSALDDKIDDEFGALPPLWQQFVERFTAWLHTTWANVQQRCAELQKVVTAQSDAKAQQKAYAQHVLKTEAQSGWSSFYFQNRQAIMAKCLDERAFRGALKAQLAKPKSALSSEVQALVSTTL